MNLMKLVMKKYHFNQEQKKKKRVLKDTSEFLAANTQEVARNTGQLNVV